MTNTAAVGFVQGFLMSQISLLDNKEYAKVLDEAWKVVRKAALEAENRRSDEGATTAWVNMPEAEEPSVKECFEQMEKNKDEFFSYLTRLQGNLCQVEKRVERLEK